MPTKVKTQKVIGKEKYINSTTKEVSEFSVVSMEENRDYNFEKIWINDLVKILELLGNSKVKVLSYLLKNKNNDNIVLATALEISKKVSVCQSSVKTTLKILRNMDMLRMKMPGVYYINPGLVVKGKSDKRQKLLADYYSIQAA